MTLNTHITRRLAPEDIVPGVFVVILHAVHEVYLPGCFSDVPGSTPTPVRLTCTDCADGEPRRVLAVCLPFVQTQDAQGNRCVLDIRRHALALVNEEYALEAFTHPKREE